LNVRGRDVEVLYVKVGRRTVDVCADLGRLVLNLSAKLLAKLLGGQERRFGIDVNRELDRTLA